MKKNMVVASLVLVILKIVYDVYTFVYDKQNLKIERYFNVAIVFFIIYYSISSRKKIKKA